MLAKLVPHEMPRPTVSRGGLSTLRREIEKLKAFHKAGLRVPSTVHVTERAFAVTDIGSCVRTLWALNPAAPATADVLVAAAAALKDVHCAGLVHGRPNLRDITWDGERIGLIDLEESPEAVMSLHAAQARDIWLLFIQLARYGGDAVLERAWEAYHPSLSTDRLQKLHGFLKILGPIVRVFGKATEFLAEKLRTDGLIPDKVGKIPTPTILL